MFLKRVPRTVEIRYVSYIKYVRRKRDYVQRSHRHAVFGHEFVYVDYGEVNVTIGKETFLLKAGDAILIKGGTWHTYAGNSSMPFSYFNSMFRGKVPAELFGRIIPVDQPSRTVLERLKNDHELPSLLLEELVISHLTELLLLFSRSVLLRKVQSEKAALPEKDPEPFLPSGTTRRYSELARKTIEIIRENFKYELRMMDVARSLNVSASHLRSLLKKETGKNFMTLLHEVRINEAQRLLQESILSSSEIAAATGYASPAFFFRIFKRLTGVTPREYSSMLKNSNFQDDSPFFNSGKQSKAPKNKQ